MDNKVMFKLSYGLYVIGSAFEGKVNAQIANTVFQINAEPVTVAISLNNNNYTKELVEKSGVFSVNVLSTEADMDIVANFGFKSGRDFDKFAAYPCTLGETGVPLLNNPKITANLEAKVIAALPVGTHTIFVGQVVEGTDLAGAAMTYADYHKMKNAAFAKPAAVKTYEAGKSYRCKVCGYIEEDGELLNDPDYTCPICGVGRDQFEEVK